jgi:hypothetical protein
MFIVIGDGKVRTCLKTKQSLKVNARERHFGGQVA